MSLSSYARFRDKDLNIVATAFINCGWWMEKGKIPMLIDDVIRSWPNVDGEPLNHEQFEFLDLYEYRVPRESINQWKRGFWTEDEMMETVTLIPDPSTMTKRERKPRHNASREMPSEFNATCTGCIPEETGEFLQFEQVSWRDPKTGALT